ncbi:MAG: hypothetical protein ACREL1_08050, partial [bacterium]
LPALRLRLWPAMLSFYLMGFALLWCAQFHMSYVLLIPFLGAALIFQYQEGFKNTVRACLGIGLGALTSGAFVIPTYLKYGFAAGSGGMTKAVALNHANFFDLFTVLGRFLSLASFEIPRFIGSHTSDRMAFLNQNPWLWPFAALLFLFWIFQVPAMALLAFQSRSADPRWKAVRFLTGLTVLEIYLSFLFSIKPPAAHTYYLTLPLALFYAFHAFKPWTTRRWFAPLAAALFFCNLAFHFGLALNHYPTQSLYHDRPLFTKAIQSKNYHLLGERRPQTLY